MYINQHLVLRKNICHVIVCQAGMEEEKTSRRNIMIIGARTSTMNGHGVCVGGGGGGEGETDVLRPRLIGWYIAFRRIHGSLQNLSRFPFLSPWNKSEATQASPKEVAFVHKKDES
jgi:hypothetical protein